MTRRQSQVLRFIEIFIEENSYSPSIREISLGINAKSTSTTHGIIEKLQASGKIKKLKARARSIEIASK